jgi:hypothetical protein
MDMFILIVALCPNTTSVIGCHTVVLPRYFMTEAACVETAKKIEEKNPKWFHHTDCLPFDQEKSYR